MATRTQIHISWTEWTDRKGIDYWVSKEMVVYDTNTYECVFRVNESDNTTDKEMALDKFVDWIKEAKAISGVKMIGNTKLSQKRENITDAHWIDFEM